MNMFPDLRELARKATPGPWKCAYGIYVYSGDTMVADNNDETALIRARGVGGGMSREQQEANVEFVSAANPTAILALLEIVDRLKYLADTFCYHLEDCASLYAYEYGDESKCTCGFVQACKDAGVNHE